MLEDIIYTKVKNISGGNVVINNLQGFCLTKDQEIDLSANFKKSHLEEASGEIRSLINHKLLVDMGEGAIIRASAPVTGGGISPEEIQNKMRDAKLRDIMGSSSVTALEDYAKDKDPEVVKSAKARLVELFGDESKDDVQGVNVGVGLQ